MKRVVITGLGIISSIGNSVSENRSSLREGICGISSLQMFPSKFSDIYPFGEIKISNETLINKLSVSEVGVTRTTLLALHAFIEAIADSNLNKEEISSSETALIGASTVGGMCLTDEMYNDSQSNTLGSSYLDSYDVGATNIYLQKRFSIGGPVNTINTACSSSANAIMYGARLINSGRVRRAIVGGFDSLAKFTINGFNALHILSNESCTPFDENRNGLNLGEGAAFLVLEKEEDVCGNKRIYASLSGYSNTNDSYHTSSLSENGDGPYKAMKEALDIAKLDPSLIDFINTHGTGTENNDVVESRAMIRLFQHVPAFTSTKANTGHTLGAAAAIEALYCILNLAEQEIYPHINFKTPISSTGLYPFQLYKKTALLHIMSNSFGFGGNCSSLIFSKA
ncbi:MAG: beta-ketoacyl-[acyl-carrier-protein] synthase family protein [Bacteroidetes bacterium]|nr:beta-ketoacyl-[acyl-carrier-protein] synthase family protein [Bacteroidota bacterium]